MYSVDFAEIEGYQATNQWERACEVLSKAAQSLEEAGTDFIVICTNTMHKVVPQIKAEIHLPILHIADATAMKIKENGIKKVGLYTMEQDFFSSRIEDKDIEILIPNENDREQLNKVIFEELCLGIIKAESKNTYINIIEKLIKEGAR